MNRNDLCVDILPHWHTAIDHCISSGGTSSSSSGCGGSSSSSRVTGTSSVTHGDNTDSESISVGVSTVTGVDVESAAALLRSCCKLLRMDLAEGGYTFH